MPKAKLHWTQTPKGRKHMAALARRRIKEGSFGPASNKQAKKGALQNDKSEARIAPQVAYCFGHCEGFLQSYARSHSMAYTDLARRVGGLLGASAGG